MHAPGPGAPTVGWRPHIIRHITLNQEPKGKDGTRRYKITNDTPFGSNVIVHHDLGIKIM